MRLFVTGGAGYVGSVVVEHLVRDGHEIVVFDDFSTGHRGAVPAGVTVRSGDLRDPEAVVRALEPGTDAVLHFASRSIVPDSMRDPVGYWEHNVGGAMSLLRAVAAARVGRFVFSSSAAVYGEAVEQPIPESAPTRPTHPYGATKRAIEMLLEDSSRTTGLRIACLRYFNAAGASRQRGEDHRPETHLIPRLVRAALSPGTSVPLYGTDYPTPDGTCLRDYVHVEDLADAHVRALRALESGSIGAVNLGSGRGTSVREILAAVERVTGTELPVRVEPRRAGDPAVLVARVERAATELGWKPERDLDEVVASALQWMRDHPHGYGEVGDEPGKSAGHDG
jgi:UDP-glucose-4-epimerase GalE